MRIWMHGWIWSAGLASSCTSPNSAFAFSEQRQLLDGEGGAASKLPPLFLFHTTKGYPYVRTQNYPRTQSRLWAAPPLAQLQGHLRDLPSPVRTGRSRG